MGKRRSKIVFFAISEGEKIQICFCACSRSLTAVVLVHHKNTKLACRYLVLSLSSAYLLDLGVLN